MTYEGGASINEPFVTSLGAGAPVVTITAGFGEFLGYALRSVYGYVAQMMESPLDHLSRHLDCFQFMAGSS